MHEILHVDPFCMQVSSPDQILPCDSIVRTLNRGCKGVYEKGTRPFGMRYLASSGLRAIRDSFTTRVRVTGDKNQHVPTASSHVNWCDSPTYRRKWRCTLIVLRTKLSVCAQEGALDLWISVQTRPWSHSQVLILLGTERARWQGGKNWGNSSLHMCMFLCVCVWVVVYMTYPRVKDPGIN